MKPTGIFLLFFSVFALGCAQSEVAPTRDADSHPYESQMSHFSAPKLQTPEYEHPSFESDGSDSERVHSSARRNSAKTYTIPKRFFLLLPVKKLKINQPFFENNHGEHLGVDIGGRKGDPIFAAHAGVVVYAGSGFHGFGKMAIIEFSKKWATLYAHMSRLRVRTGHFVKAGQRIGDMGRTGHATGVHLHFELLLNKIPIDPLPYLKRAAEYSY